jgi:hypothetical protein
LAQIETQSAHGRVGNRIDFGWVHAAQN